MYEELEIKPHFCCRGPPVFDLLESTHRSKYNSNDWPESNQKSSVCTSWKSNDCPAPFPTKGRVQFRRLTKRLTIPTPTQTAKSKRKCANHWKKWNNLFNPGVFSTISALRMRIQRKKWNNLRVLRRITKYLTSFQQQLRFPKNLRNSEISIMLFWRPFNNHFDF